MSIQEFIKELEKLNIKVEKKELEALEIYAQMLIQENKKYNLTAITDVEDIYLKHFYDSLTITKLIDLNKSLKILDIGTGAGFPGIVLKIFYPNLEVTLIDSNNKKITFLKNVIEKLHLNNINCILGRVEDLSINYREHFDIVTSRAVASLRILVELAIPFTKISGYFIPLKGRDDKELENAIDTINVLNCEIESIIKFNLPDNKSMRTIYKIKKFKKTPNNFPRKYDKIKKQALK